MIFLDNASTTKINKQVNDLIYQVNSEFFFNPSALYKQSIDVTSKILQAKQQIGECLNVNPDNILFTSGATESNNTAIKGFLTGNKNAEYIFSMGEHPSVYEVAQSLKNMGYKVNFVNLNKQGSVDIEHFKTLLNENTHFVSIMHISNETGAINDIQQLCQMAKNVNPNCIFHCDGVQAVGKINVDLQKLNVDAYSVSAHKFNGPKGCGILYVKNFNKFKPFILGGGQQTARRSGTENVSGILSTALAMKIACQNNNENFNNVLKLRNYFVEQISNNLSDYIINQSPNNSPYVLSVSFKGLKGEVIQHMMEEKGVLIGTGSACSSKKSNNRTLQNMGVEKSYINGSVRISFSYSNTMEEIIEASQCFVNVIKELSEKVR